MGGGWACRSIIMYGGCCCWLGCWAMLGGGTRLGQGVRIFLSMLESGILEKERERERHGLGLYFWLVIIDPKTNGSLYFRWLHRAATAAHAVAPPLLPPAALLLLPLPLSTLTVDHACSSHSFFFFALRRHPPQLLILPLILWRPSRTFRWGRGGGGGCLPAPRPCPRPRPRPRPQMCVETLQESLRNRSFDPLHFWLMYNCNLSPFLAPPPSPLSALLRLVVVVSYCCCCVGGGLRFRWQRWWWRSYELSLLY
ncbi:hypothetical protein PIB30_011463 [Stylosanthes scabra]|uniref:Uncharacterized protein n=1 Tax=Stylosanthes scabra TaxID=79078 RepID=A0ABU6R689_9FABA|nr:hypothetical protein [Stylosanthes scabra]